MFSVTQNSVGINQFPFAPTVVPNQPHVRSRSQNFEMASFHSKQEQEFQRKKCERQRSIQMNRDIKYCDLYQRSTSLQHIPCTDPLPPTAPDSNPPSDTQPETQANKK
jgi:hypothetical protein